MYRLFHRMNLLAVRDLETCSFVIFEYIYIYIRVTEYSGKVHEATKRFLSGFLFFHSFFFFTDKFVYIGTIIESCNNVMGEGRRGEGRKESRVLYNDQWRIGKDDDSFIRFQE